MSEEFYEDEYDRSRTPDSSGRGLGWIILLILGVVFLPAVAIATTVYYVMLRWLRQPPSVTATVSSLLVLTAIIGWNVTDSWETIQYVFSGFGTFLNSWSDLIVPILWINLVIGAIFGYVLSMLSIRGMQKNPDRVALEGGWEYQFEYRRTPLQLLRRRQRIKGLKAGNFVTSGLSPLGIDEKTEDRVVYRYGDEASKHTLMSGASGSGKTITLLSMALSDIINGEPVFVIDFKRSPELAGKLAAWAAEYGANFYHFVNGDPATYDVEHSKGQSFYDPLSSGSPTAQADMVLGMREYDTAAEVYRTSMQQLLQVLFQMIHYGKEKRKHLTGRELDRFAPKIEWDKGGIYLVYSAVENNEAFGQLVEVCQNTPIEKEANGLYEQIHGKTQIAHAMAELTGQMRTIVASEYGRWMQAADPERTIDLLKLSGEQSNVVLFSLNSDDEAFFAKYVGSMILADLTSVSSKRRNLGMKNKVNVYVDEFQAVNPDSVKGLLEKARESRMALTLAQQSFEQIITAAGTNGEAYLNALLGTCSNFIAHAGSNEASAERLSGILGKDDFPAYKRTNQNDRFIFSLNWFNRRAGTVITGTEERWICDPSEFLQLSMPDRNNGYRSTAVVLNKSVSDPRYEAKKGGGTARTVWMIPDDRVIGSYYEPKMAETDVEYLELVRENKILEQDNYLDDTHPALVGAAPNEEYEFDPNEPIAGMDEYANHNLPNFDPGDDDDDFVRAVIEAPDVSAEDDPVDDDDGTFAWEVIDDEGDDIPTAESLGVSFDRAPEPEPRRAPTPPPAQRTQSGVRGLPTVPHGGLPTAPGTKSGMKSKSTPPRQEPFSERQSPQRPPTNFQDYWSQDIKPETLADTVPSPKAKAVRSKSRTKTPPKDTSAGLPDIELPDL